MSDADLLDVWTLVSDACRCGGRWCRTLAVAVFVCLSELMGDKYWLVCTGLVACVQYCASELLAALVAVLGVNSWCGSWVAVVTVMVANGCSYWLSFGRYK